MEPRQSPMRRLAGALSQSLEPLSMWAYKRSGQGTIVLFHRVSGSPDSAYPPLAPAEFERHCGFLREHFTVIPLGELVARHRAGKSLARLAAITFDDGYRDFLTDAYPILRKLGLPSTHFLVEECLRSGLPTWNLRLRHLFPDDVSRVPHFRALAKMPARERIGWIEERERGGSPSYPAMLSPADLRAMDGALVAWESHTATHALLDECPPAELERELGGSKHAIAEMTGRPVRFVSYPNGASNQAARAAAASAGYDGAFTVGQASLKTGCDPFAIPRHDIGGLPRSMLASEISGIHSALRGLT
jgi:peptidoglycan/xylan/chitin deacetylase (PgdA/CDA1 family)